MVSWFVDPAALELRLRHPEATVRDCCDHGWLVPGFLHARFNSLAGGRYLSIEINHRTQPVDFADLTQYPVFLISVTRSQITTIRPVFATHEELSLVLNECDLSLLPAAELRELGTLPGTNRFCYGCP